MKRGNLTNFYRTQLAGFDVTSRCKKPYLPFCGANLPLQRCRRSVSEYRLTCQPHDGRRNDRSFLAGAERNVCRSKAAAALILVRPRVR